MLLSREREAELVEKNMPKIYRAVDNYMARYTGDCGARHVSYDDCVQEVSIAFLKYLRSCDSEEQIEKFPWFTATHAMSELVLRNQQVSVPVRTSSFMRTLRSLPKTVSFDLLVSNGIEVDGMSKHWVPDKDTEIDFSAFMSSQDENVQRIAAMRMYGLSQRDIAAQFGLCKRSVEKIIAKLRENYNDFTKEEDEDE